MSRSLTGAGSGINKLVSELFEIDFGVRYVAINQDGRIVEMQQNSRWPSKNPVETDHTEELIVNPVIPELARRRGDLDLNGVQT